MPLYEYISQYSVPLQHLQVLLQEVSVGSQAIALSPVELFINILYALMSNHFGKGCLLFHNLSRYENEYKINVIS